VSECSWIDQNAVDSTVRTLPNPIDEITLVIALSTIDNDAQLFTELFKSPMNVFKSVRTVNTRFATPQAIEVWTAQNEHV
jgi:hypothetical protein